MDDGKIGFRKGLRYSKLKIYRCLATCGGDTRFPNLSGDEGYFLVDNANSLEWCANLEIQAFSRN